jgi:hypothetical protein
LTNCQSSLPGRNPESATCGIPAAARPKPTTAEKCGALTVTVSAVCEIGGSGVRPPSSAYQNTIGTSSGASVIGNVTATGSARSAPSTSILNSAVAGRMNAGSEDPTTGARVIATCAVAGTAPGGNSRLIPAPPTVAPAALTAAVTTGSRSPNSSAPVSVAVAPSSGEAPWPFGLATGGGSSVGAAAPSTLPYAPPGVDGVEPALASWRAGAPVRVRTSAAMPPATTTASPAKIARRRGRAGAGATAARTCPQRGQKRARCSTTWPHAAQLRGPG